MPVESTAMVRETLKHRPRNSPDLASGVLLIDKPPGITSHDVVDHIRKLYRTRRVGHTGTLDPIASGLMLVLVERATKIAPYLTVLSKRYLASIRLGVVSDTGDSEGTLTETGNPSSVSTDQIREALFAFVGETAQRIPAYSAVRSSGRRLYELARRGEDVPELERTVTIHSAELVEHNGDTADVRIDCSSGTYVRSLAEALGEVLGCGAHMCGLRREAVGRWLVNDAWSLDALQKMKREDEDLPAPSPIEGYLDYPKITITPQSRDSVVHGSPLNPDCVSAIEGQFKCEDTILVVDEAREVLAIATALKESDQIQDWPANDAILRYRRVLIQ